jgi:SAM-dependent methyltransferase
MHCWVCGEHAGFDRLEVRDADRGVDEYCLILCCACRSGALEHSPLPEVLGRHYDASYYGGGDSKFAAPLQAIVNLSTRMRARAILNSLHCTPAPLVLDIGCGRGSLLAELAGLGARGIGLERAAPGSFRGHAGVELRLGELTEQRFPAAGFDAVVLWHVLEHLGNPQAALVEIGRIIKPGGLLVIAVPNNASWQARFFGRYWFHLDVPRHLHFFGHAGLLRLLRQQGYEVQAGSTFDPVQNLFGFIQSCLNGISGSAPNRLYQLMRSAQAPIRVLQMLLWMLPACLLLPFALVEAACCAARGDGACSIIFASKKHCTG